MNPNLLYKWVAILTCTLFGFFVIHMFGLWTALWSADQTKISFIILLVWFIIIICFIQYSNPKSRQRFVVVYCGEHGILGLIGTVSGS